MSDKKISREKRKTADQRVSMIVDAAKKYKSETGEFPERRKIAELTGISHSSVQEIIRDIYKTSGKLYARNLTATERGQRSKASREGREYETL